MATALSSALLGTDCVGRTIAGRFPLLRWLGGTAHASVYLTELEDEPAQKAAIKLITADEVDADTCLAEWAAAKTLSHPHLMRVLYAGHGELDGADLLYVVTEYADEVLSEILRERPLTPAETGAMLDPVLEALSWLHTHNLVHGHLQPSNIMVAGDRLKLSTDGLYAFTDPGRAASSGNYAAPEIALGQISPAADVWSLGIVLVEALTQRPPLRDRSRDGEPVLPASLPQPFFGIAQECLRMDPALRSTVSGVRDSLEAARTAEPAVTPLLPLRARVTIACMMLVLGATITAMVMASHRRLWPPVPGQVLAQAVAQSPAAAIHPKSAVAATQPQPQPQPPAPAAATRAPLPIPPPQSPAPVAQAHAAPHTGSVVRGAVVYQAIPEIPQHIIDDVQGHFHVRINVQVDSAGAVSGAAIDSPGPSQYFANKALAAAQTWKFTPAQQDGLAVASTWTLQFSFSDSGITVTPTETSP
jgi:TonB family protein